jgi:hypothetical protein
LSILVEGVSCGENAVWLITDHNALWRESVVLICKRLLFGLVRYSSPRY